MSEAAEGFFNSVEDYIRQSWDLLAKGKFDEMAALEGLAKQVCDTAGVLMNGLESGYGARLEALKAELDTLARALQVQRDAAAEELRGLSRHQQASVAYRVAGKQEE